VKCHSRVLGAVDWIFQYAVDWIFQYAVAKSLVGEAYRDGQTYRILKDGLQ